MTVQTALQQGTKVLEDAGIAAPRLTAEVLLSHALGRDRVYLYSHGGEDLPELPWLHFGRYLWERAGGKPTQYITKRQEFFGREFRVGPGVLIPRPETELVVEAALERFRDGMRAVDVGCGSGAIAVTLSLERGAWVFASDISQNAIAIASRNARDLQARVAFLQADLLSCFAPGSLHLAVSNPPYVAEHEREGLQREVRDHEPSVALFGGATGNEIYERIVEQAGRALVPGGWLILELGYRSHDAVRGLLGDGWTAVSARDDLSGIPRVLCARRAA